MAASQTAAWYQYLVHNLCACIARKLIQPKCSGVCLRDLDDHMKTPSLYLGLVACLLIAGVARADSVYTYILQLPTINSSGQEVDSGFTDYEFSWQGPLVYDAAPNTDCPTVCGPVTPGSTVEDGYIFDGFTFTSNGVDAEVQVKFIEPDINEAEAELGIEGNVEVCTECTKIITFTFVEPDSFWATQGTDISFPSLGSAGASFSVTGLADPTCDKCTVDISAAATATPEPRSAILLVALLAAFGLVMRHRGQ
jgi:hypothetical protein